MPVACSECHRASTAGSAFAGDYELYGWARSGHADYLDTGIGGYGDRLTRTAATAEPYNSVSNEACVPCHTGDGYVAALAGDGAGGASHPADGEELPELHHVPRLRGPGREAACAPDRHRHLSERSLRDGGERTRRSASHATQAAIRRRASTRRSPWAESSTWGTSTPISFPRPRSCTGRSPGAGTNTPGRDYTNILSVVHIAASCAACHMAAGPSANWNLGGHALAMTDGSALNTTACSSTGCHGPVTTFDVRGTDPQGEAGHPPGPAGHGVGGERGREGQPLRLPLLHQHHDGGGASRRLQLHVRLRRSGSPRAQLVVRGPASLRLAERSGQHGGVSRQ